MRKRGRAAIVHAIWAIAGVAAGASAALLWMSGFKSEWVEATGTWFGAIATVLALLWAVQTFRADQAHRDAERDDKELARRETLEEQAEAARNAELQADAAILAEAGLVEILLAGGAGQGDSDKLQMTSVHVDLRNDAAHTVVIESFELVFPLEAKRYPRFPIRVTGDHAQHHQLEVHLIDAYPNELSGAPLPRFIANMTYRLNGRRWTRTSDEDSVPIAAE